METCYVGINQVATGARIRDLRKARGLKVKDISSFMGFESTQAVYKWQRGESLPDLGNMIRLMELFKISDIKEIVILTGSADEALPVIYWVKVPKPLIASSTVMTPVPTP